MSDETTPLDLLNTERSKGKQKYEKKINQDINTFLYQEITQMFNTFAPHYMHATMSINLHKHLIALIEKTTI